VSVSIDSENQPEVKPTETLVEMNDRDEVVTLVEVSEPEVEVKPQMIVIHFIFLPLLGLDT
jgi:hypothetical protein